VDIDIHNHVKINVIFVLRTSTSAAYFFILNFYFDFFFILDPFDALTTL